MSNKDHLTIIIIMVNHHHIFIVIPYNIFESRLSFFLFLLWLFNTHNSLGLFPLFFCTKNFFFFSINLPFSSVCLQKRCQNYLGRKIWIHSLHLFLIILPLFMMEKNNFPIIVYKIYKNLIPTIASHPPADIHKSILRSRLSSTF